MSNQAKLVRSQLRQLVKEMWPEIVQTEIYKKVLEESKKTLELVVERAEKSTKNMQEKHEAVLSMLMREFSRPAQPAVLQNQSSDQSPLKPPTETI